MRTYLDGKKIYSVDMLITYVNIFKIKAKTVNIINLLDYLTYNTWTDKNDKPISPADVVQHPKKYPHHMTRINKANLKYPVMICENRVVDGIHRIAKTYLTHKKTIKIHIIPKNVMDKCLLDKMGNYDKIVDMAIFELIILFNKRFGLSTKPKKSQ